MKKNFIRTTGLISLLVIFISACDNGNNNSRPSGIPTASPTPTPTATPTPPPGGFEVTLSGVAAKGIVVGGIVNVHPIVNGAIDTNATFVTSTTGDGGDYNVTIDDYDGSPFVVRITTADTTTMRCDLASGCGDGISFGDDVPLTDSAFNLDAVVPPIPQSEPSANINLSVLTDTATQVALSTIVVESTTAAEEIAQIISNANTSVANRFGIVGDVTTLPVVDLTDMASVSAASDDAIQYNLYNAAIVEALISDDSSLSITSAVQTFANQFANDEGIADREENDSTSITLSEILQESSNIINEINEFATEVGIDVNLNQLQTIIDTNRELADMGSTEPTNGIPTDGDLSELQAVKEMVNDIRTLGVVFTDDNEADIFAEEIELATETFDDESGVVFEALAIATTAIANAVVAYEDDDTITSYNDTDSELTVSISVANDTVTYEIDSDIAVDNATVDSAMTAVDTASDITSTEADPVEGDNGSVTTVTTSTGTIDLALSGSFDSGDVSLTVTNGDVDIQLSGTLTTVDLSATDQGGSTSTVDSEIATLALDLDVSLTESGDNVTDPITFTGGVDLAFTNIDIEAEGDTDYEFEGDNELIDMIDSWVDSFDIERLSFTAAGTFESQSGSSLTLTIAIIAESGDLVYTCENDQCTEETSQSFVDVTFTIAAAQDIDGLDNSEVTIMASGERTDLEDAALEIDVINGTTNLMISYDTATDNTISITNEAGAVMTLTENAQTEEITGTIVLNDTTYATISEDLGTIIFSYNDGFNESF